MSFHARATWGLLPMRKKLNEKNMKVPHPEGDVQEDFVSVRHRLMNLGIPVSFFDPNPEIHDSSDIADLLIQSGPPVFYVEPDLKSLTLPTPDDPQSNTDPPKRPDLPPAGVQIPSQGIGFQIRAKDGVAECSIYVEAGVGVIADARAKSPEFDKLLTSGIFGFGTITKSDARDADGYATATEYEERTRQRWADSKRESFFTEETEERRGTRKPKRRS
jgi:hypothetical protein